MSWVKESFSLGLDVQNVINQGTEVELVCLK